VIGIVRGTIQSIYPAYYPPGAVDFFLEYHSDDAIRSAIARGEVYLFESDGGFVATGSLEGNYLTRLFVLPECQGNGVGSRVMDFLEGIAFQTFSEARLDASLPAVGMYLKRGYTIFEYHRERTNRGHFLCYFDMRKARPESREPAGA
jgi:GNAT superfamily N-acetyltransferase